jgi:lipopolysaccharide/colanic/teichoic acid biosynthesis glycosyltransferase
LIKIRYRHFKCLIDYLGAGVLLALTAPLFLLIALLVKLDSPGPVFYRQWRVGRQGRVFRIWKFRSMRNDAESQSGPVWAKKDDPRATRVGSMLRKSHLDELPQLFNGVLGQMSLIGPRPERPEMVATLRDRIAGYERRLEVKPGITGLAQVKHRYDTTLKDVRDKIRYDAIYIRKACLLLDMKIAAVTIRKMLLMADPG